MNDHAGPRDQDLATPEDQSKANVFIPARWTRKALKTVPRGCSAKGA